MTLKRNAAPVSQGTTFVQIDDLSYQYTGNRLDKVIESAMNDTGYEGGNNIIDYDLNGNMINMKDKGIQTIVYNYLNLPESYTISQNSPLGVVTGFGLNYLYRADGTKVRKTYRSEGGKGSTMITTNMTDYLDGFQYRYSEVSTCLWCRTSVAYEQEAFKNESDINGLKPITPAWILDFVSTPEGFYSFAENRYIYQYKDHLGNSRVSFAKNSSGALEITDTNNYYAFGMNHIGGVKGLLGGYLNYKYNGKELQETGMYDYGARFYMADLGRWGVIDPLSERYIKVSPYHYAFNNPIFFKDPDGQRIVIYFQSGSGSMKEWEYSYSKERNATGNDFLDSAVAALDALYASNALNLDTDGDGKKDRNYLQELIDSDKVLGVTSGEKNDFVRSSSYDKKSKEWRSDDSSAIGRIRFNTKKGFLFNNSEFNDENKKALIERYQSGQLNKDDKINSVISGLGHEIIHAGNFMYDNVNYFQRIKPFDKLDSNGFTNNEEIRTTFLSNQVNEALGEPQRKVYWGIKVPTSSIKSTTLKK